jgi:Fe-S oxidoreductase
MNDPRVKRLLGFHAARTLPVPARETFSRWFARRPGPARAGEPVLLFMDPITEYLEPHIGIAAVELLERAGYAVTPTRGIESGRVQLSQGLLRQARGRLDAAIERLYPAAASGQAILGLEPSEILSFRDEAPDLVSAPLRDKARVVAGKARLFEELVAEQAVAGRFSSMAFDETPRRLLVHGHCHAKALTGMRPLLEALAVLPGARAEAIPSGCCGMAGAFGYEEEHYELSMRIGELVLFPAIRKAPADTLIVAGGTSCRHQIRDGVGRQALHPAEVLRAALVS